MSAVIPCPIAQGAKAHPHTTAVFTPERPVSYAQLHELVSGTQAQLHKLNIQPQQRVGIFAWNQIETVTLLFALWRQKAVACLGNTRVPAPAGDDLLGQVECTCGVTTFSDLLNAQHTAVTWHRMDGLIREGEGAHASYALDQDATICFTSGSTARPKAVLHTFGNHYYNAVGSQTHLPVGSGDCWLLSLPLYHVSGLSVLFRTLFHSASLAMSQGSGRIGEDLTNFPMTHVSLVPAQLYDLLRDTKNIAALQRLKAILLGGSAVPERLIRKIKEYDLPVYLTYGLTETASQVATTDNISLLTSPQGAKVLPERTLTLSEEKEILVKGPVLFKGYVTGAEIKPALNAEGWFATGDLGRFTHEHRLLVLGRKDNMFISGGENIHPEEIEQCLCRRDDIVQAIVVPAQDPKFGHIPVAFIQRVQPGNPADEEIISYLKNYLPRYKVPKAFFPWPDNPESCIKISRSELKQRAGEYRNTKYE